MPEAVADPDRSAVAGEPLPWHGAAWDLLQRQRTEGLLPHALLLVGQPGTGKAEFAAALARGLLCAHPRRGLPCGACHACEISAAGNHGDFLWIRPAGESRAIRIEQVRQAIVFAQGTPSFGRCKVLVFEPADRINNNGFNALLKSLEEPPAGTYLILVCDRLQGVPATIRSRCQVLRLAAPRREEAIDWLRCRVTKEADLERILRLADDSPLLAERLLEGGEAEAMMLRREALRQVLEGNVAITEVWNLWGEADPGEFLEEVAATLRAFLCEMSSDALRQPKGRAAFVLLDEIQRLQRAVAAGANPGRQLLVDVLLEKCHRLLGAARRGASIRRSADGGQGV